MIDDKSSSAPKRSKEETRKRNRKLLVVTLIPLAAMFVLVSYAPTLYQKFCAAFGAAGYVSRASTTTATKAAAAVSESDKAKTMEVSFDANVAPGLAMEFKPLQKKVEAKFGEQTKIYYYAKNLSDKTIVARAVFNVTPYKAAPYFFKTQCFCFTKEKLGPGESAKLPVVFFIDDALLKDKYVNDVHQMALSYTFYPQKVSADEVSKARDLKAGSVAEDKDLTVAKDNKFENEAPRQ